MFSFILLEMLDTVKPAHEVTSITQSPVINGYLFLVLSKKKFIWIEPLFWSLFYI